MVYDQAQSPRLGQRTPVESTFVRSFDVDPTSGDAELLEAAWPGMLIYRSDLHILQIYDGVAWEDVGAGVAGQLTYVGTSPPVAGPGDPAFKVGDLWYDSDDGYHGYVWDGDSWEPTGTGGLKTFRQPAPPISTTVGDLWYDSNDSDRQYRAAAIGVSTIGAGGWELVLDVGAQQSANTAQTTADLKTQVYYAPGLHSELGDPPPVVPPVGRTLGDVWFQTDDDNRMWYYTGNTAIGNQGWVDAHDPNIDQALYGINQNATSINSLQDQTNYTSIVATSADNSADTAAGLVSMSDYLPDTRDVTYLVEKTDPVTGSPYVVEVPRPEGSIWFTRTRSRKNWCTNPSFEAGTTGWSVLNATMVREKPAAPALPPAGYDPANPATTGYALKVTNDGNAVAHTLYWGASAAVSAAQSQYWCASVYAETVSGSPASLTIALVWTDDVGTTIKISTGTPLSPVLNAWQPQIASTITEQRLSVVDLAPAGATKVYVLISSPTPNAVYHLDALLLEQTDDLGRYFDGNSYDGYWGTWDLRTSQVVVGTPNASTSGLVGNKIQQIYELRDGGWANKLLTGYSISSIDGSQITGSINGTLLADNTVAPDKAAAVQVLCSQALVPGDLVNVWNNNGISNVRKADATTGKAYEAMGFVWSNYAVGQYAYVYHVGYVPFLSNLAPGPQWLSTVPGRATDRAPQATGNLVQRVGFAPSNTVLDVVLGQPYRII